MKDYRDNGASKTIDLDGVEFLRRFCMHIFAETVRQDALLRRLQHQILQRSGKRSRQDDHKTARNHRRTIKAHLQF
jgi:hypothetical protein